MLGWGCRGGDSGMKHSNTVQLEVTPEEALVRLQEAEKRIQHLERQARPPPLGFPPACRRTPRGRPLPSARRGLNGRESPEDIPKIPEMARAARLSALGSGLRLAGAAWCRDGRRGLGLGAERAPCALVALAYVLLRMGRDTAKRSH